MKKNIEPAKVWITKYATTKGVQSGTVFMGKFSVAGIEGGMLVLGGHNYFHGREWHLSEEAAIADAKKRVEAKIASLNKQKNKLLDLLELLKNR